MNYLWTSFKKHKKLLLFLSIIFIIGLISGIIYFNEINKTFLVSIENSLFDVTFKSNIFYHIIFLSIIVFFSVLIIGAFIGVFLLFYEALSIGLILGTFFSIYGLSGIVFCLIFILLYKFIYTIFFLLIIIKSYELAKNIIGYFILKKDTELKNIAIFNFIVLIKYSLIIISYDLFLTFFGNKIISIFNFLI